MTPTLELTAEEIAKIEQMRAAAAKKAEDERRKNMPGFSFRIEMNDGTSVVWSGKAPNEDVAIEEAINKAEKENDSGVLAYCKRLYMPKGRKAVSGVTSAPEGFWLELKTEGDKEEDQAA